MIGIVEFLNARFNEDEQVAQTAIDGDPDYAEWAYAGEMDSYSGGEVYAPNSLSDSKNYPRYVTMDREGILSSVQPEQAAHIARHDPARVLREVTAKRTILNAYNESRWDKGEGHEDYATGKERGLEAAVEAIAAVYAGHPDYRTDW